MKVTNARRQADYRGGRRNAQVLTITSEHPLPIDEAWTRVKSSGTLTFIATGKVTFRPIGGAFPPTWTEGDRIGTRMLLYGFLPFGGVHSLYFERIDEDARVMQTRERDSVVTLWDHRISLTATSEASVTYEDEIVIYAGLLTPFIVAWARSFYAHRQRRWQILANEVRATDPTAP